MQQLTQKLGSGKMKVQDVPLPQLEDGMVLVKNHYSVISASTEGTTVSSARKNLVQKAKEKPQQVKQVLGTLKAQGPVQTYRAVKKKLDAYSPLGYSSAGEVISVGKGVSEFVKGDLVACAGVGYANHAEIVSVPKNLCVKLSKKANIRTAAYNTLGAIALQGVRQADLRLGESCAVIGLGLIGQITCQILKASGVNVVGIDIDQNAVQLAKHNGINYVFTRSTYSLKQKILDATMCGGVDCVIITAATSSLDPINFAGAISRKKGKVVVLGAVPTGFDRDPHWYKKELELKMSCSYGPGRYDLNYEEKGIDYPAAYVRWTEKRNMEAFQNLLALGEIKIDYLTSHEFPFDDAPIAYDLVLNRSEPYFGIILKYSARKSHNAVKLQTNKLSNNSSINLGFIGAGSYAQSNLLPNIPNYPWISKKGVLTYSGTSSKRVAEKYGFDFCTAEQKDIFNSEDINTVFVVTRHNSHAEYVLKALKSKKHVFVEKPLCLNENELKEIIETYQNLSIRPQLMVGFNRRFSPLSNQLKQQIGTGLMSMIYRVNAGSIPKDNWIQDIEIGGGRIIGEVCHFIDYLTWLNGSLPVSVFATALPDAANNNDTVNIQLTFSNGSTGVIAYYANGPKSLPKEYIEVFNAGTAGIINNFKTLTTYGKRKQRKKLLNINKGQKQMVNQYLQSILGGKPLISFDEIVAVTKASFAVLESLKVGIPVKI